MIHFEYYKYTASSVIYKSVQIIFQNKKSSTAKKFFSNTKPLINQLYINTIEIKYLMRKL